MMHFTIKKFYLYCRKNDSIFLLGVPNANKNINFSLNFISNFSMKRRAFTSNCSKYHGSSKKAIETNS